MTETDLANPTDATASRPARPMIPVHPALSKADGRIIFEHDAAAFSLICLDCGNRPHPVNTHCGYRYDYAGGPKCGHPCNCAFQPEIAYHRGNASRLP